MIFLTIQRPNSLHNRLLQILYSLKIVVVYGRAFQMPPKSLDEIQVGSIRGIPDYRQSTLMTVDVFPHSLRVMDRTIVQEQVYVFTVTIDVFNKPMQKIEKLGAAFLFGDQCRKLSGHRIQGAKNRHLAIDSGRWNYYSPTTCRPASR